jgi:hypothetical protein
MDSDNPPKVGVAVPDLKSTMTMPIPPQRVEVAVYTTHERYLSSPTDENALYIGRDHQKELNRDKFVFDVEVERDV